MSDTILIALIVSIGPTAAGVASLIASLRVHREVRTLNESTLGELGAEDETRRIRVLIAAGAPLTAKEQRHINAARESE